MKPLITLILLSSIAIISCKKASTPVLETVQKETQSPPEQTPPEQPPVQQVKFKNVIILGNSITYAGAYGEWTGNWGMAASAKDSDYVHRLAVRFKQLEPTCKVTARNIAEFEVDYVHYNIDAQLKDLRDSLPDLLILRIGEDINTNGYNASVYKQRYEALVNYFLANNPKLTVLAVGPLWNEYLMKDIMQYTPYVSLINVYNDFSNTAHGLFKTPGIEQHPCDKGMRVIADSIWAGVSRLKPVE